MKETTEKKQVCILTPGIYPVPVTEGGAVETLVEMIVEDYELNDSKCSLSIISKYCDSAKKQAQIFNKTKFYFIKYSPVAMKRYKFIKRVVRKIFGLTPVGGDPYISQALKIINENKFDVVIVENSIYYADYLKKHCHSKIVFHLHNAPNDYMRQNHKKLLKNCDMLIAVSDFVAKDVKKIGFYDIPIVTVKNRIDTLQFSKNTMDAKKSKELRKKYGFLDDDIVCLFVGRLIPEKGIHLLINAIEKINERNIKLLIVGGTAFHDSHKTIFEEKINSQAKYLKDRVTFTGYVDYSTIPEYYHACDIAIFPSQCKEAAGLVVLEAQSAGKPVIISNAGGMSEYVNNQSAIIINNGDNFISDLAHAILTLGKSQKLRKNMGEKGILFSAKFDKRGYFNEIMHVIDNIPK